MILTAINKHAPLFQKKFTRPPAPWMKGIEIKHKQRKRDHWWHEAHKNPTNERDFRDVRNEIKESINKEKRQFYGKILCLKNSKKIWKVIHHILRPNGNTLTHFSPVSHFYTPWKRQKTFGFLTFSWSIEMWRWTKMD